MIKITVSDLFSLIKKLNKNEKTKLAESLNSADKRAKFYKLFLLISASQHIDEKSWKAEFENQESYFEAKKYLFKRISNLLIVESANDDDELKGIFDFQFAYSLYKKNLLEFAEKVLNKILEEELASKTIAIRIQSLRLLNRIALSRQDDAHSARLTKLLNESLSYFVLCEKYNNLTLVNSYKTKVITKLEFAEYIKDEKKFTNFSDIIIYNTFMCLVQERIFFDSEKAFLYIKKNYAVYQKTSANKAHFKNETNFESAMIVLHNYFWVLITQKNYAEAKKSLNEITVFKNEYYPNNTLANKICMLSDLFYAVKSEFELQNTIDKHTEVIEGKTEDFTKGPINKQISIYYLCSLYLNNDYKLAIKYFLSIAPKPKVENENELANFLNTFSYIIFIMAHIKQKNVEVVKNNLAKILHYSHSNNIELNEFIIAFVNFIKIKISSHSEKLINDSLKTLSAKFNKPYFTIYQFIDIVYICKIL